MSMTTRQMSDAKRNGPRRARRGKKKINGNGNGRGAAERKRRPPLPGGKMAFAPAAVAKARRTNRPKVTTRPNGDAYVRHREYIAEVKGPFTAGPATDFNVTAYAINPGQATTFPWLSRVASNYESYKFKKLKFSFETESSSITAGSMQLVVDYDAKDDAPTSKVQAMAYRGSVRSSPWLFCEHTSDIEDLSKNKSYYVRIGAQPPQTDIKTYDVGNLFVSTQGLLVSLATLGELYVEYEVELMTPVYENAGGIQCAGGRVLNNGTLSPANPLGDGVAHVSPGAVGIAMDNDSNLFFAQPGQYLVDFNVVGTLITTLIATAATADINVLSIAFAIAAGGGSALRAFRIVVAAPGVVSFDNTGNMATVTNSSIFVAQMPFGS